MEFLKNQVKLKIHRIRLTGDWTLQKKRSAKLNKSQKKLLRLNHTEGNCLKKKKEKQTSLVVQWLRIHPPMQGTQVRILVWEDSTSRRATKPMCRSYGAQAR